MECEYAGELEVKTKQRDLEMNLFFKVDTHYPLAIKYYIPKDKKQKTHTGLEVHCELWFLKLP